VGGRFTLIAGTNGPNRDPDNDLFGYVFYTSSHSLLVTVAVLGSNMIKLIGF